MKKGHEIIEAYSVHNGEQWCYAGTTHREVLNLVEADLCNLDEDMDLEIRVKKYKTTQEEIDALPEM